MEHEQYECPRFSLETLDQQFYSTTCNTGDDIRIPSARENRSIWWDIAKLKELQTRVTLKLSPASRLLTIRNTQVNFRLRLKWPDATKHRIYSSEASKTFIIKFTGRCPILVFLMGDRFRDSLRNTDFGTRRFFCSVFSYASHTSTSTSFWVQRFLAFEWTKGSSWPRFRSVSSYWAGRNE